MGKQSILHIQNFQCVNRTINSNATYNEDQVTCQRCIKHIAISKHGREILNTHPDAKYFRVIHMAGVECRDNKYCDHFCITKNIFEVNCSYCKKIIEPLFRQAKARGFVAVRVGRGILKNNMEYTRNLEDSGVMILSSPFNFNRAFQEEHKHYDFTIDIKNIRKNGLNAYMIPDESYKIKKVA